MQKHLRQPSGLASLRWKVPTAHSSHCRPVTLGCGRGMGNWWHWGWENCRGLDWVQGEMEWVQWGSGSGATGLGLADTHLAAARAAHRVLASTCVTLDELLACGERRVRVGRAIWDGRDVWDTHRYGCTCRQAGWGFPHSPGHTCRGHGWVGGSRGTLNHRWCFAPTLHTHLSQRRPA